MKKIILLVSIYLISFYAFSQEELSFSKVIQVENLSKDDIYSGLIIWIAQNYASSDDHYVSDKDAGYIVKDAAFEYMPDGYNYFCYRGYVKFKLKFQIKDGRYKVDFTSFRHTTINNCSYIAAQGVITTSESTPLTGLGKKFHQKVWEELKLRCESYANAMIMNLEKIDYNQKNSKESNDW